MKPNPFQKTSKRYQIEKMFDSISKEYDLLNRLITFGFDSKWKKKIVSIAKKHNPNIILDLATGTADIAIELYKINYAKIVGVDISKKMLDIGRSKIKSNKLSKRIVLESGDAQNLNYKDENFDLITIGFGLRNFENLEKGLIEMHRVLKKKGVLIILETSVPQNYVIRYFYLIFIRSFIPFIGSIFSKNKNAYNYLQRSAEKFPSGKKLISILNKCGYSNIEVRPQMFGSTSIYLANK